MELDNIKPIRKNTVRFSLEKMLGLKGGYMRDGCENIRAVSCGPLNTVAMVDTTLPGFVINVEVLKVVVEVD